MDKVLFVVADTPVTQEMALYGAAALIAVLLVGLVIRQYHLRHQAALEAAAAAAEQLRANFTQQVADRDGRIRDLDRALTHERQRAEQGIGEEREKNTELRAELAATRQAMDAVVERTEHLSTRLDAAGNPEENGVAEALLALQDRMVKLEEAAKSTPLATPAPLSPGQAARPVDPSLPTEDCIPQGTRFMVTMDGENPICQSKIVITASAITAEMVALNNGVTLVPGTPSPLPGGACTASLLSTDEAGFAELRVDCR